MNWRVLLAFLFGMLIVVGFAMIPSDTQATASTNNSAALEVPVIAGVVPPGNPAPTMPMPPEPQIIAVSSGCASGVCSSPATTVTRERTVIRSVSSEGERVVSGRRVGRVATTPIRAVGRLLLRRR